MRSTKVLKEFQNDASSIIRFTGAKGTPKNDEYLRANKELWEAMQEQREWLDKVMRICKKRKIEGPGPGSWGLPWAEKRSK